jgi:hypothetical protein
VLNFYFIARNKDNKTFNLIIVLCINLQDMQLGTDQAYLNIGIVENLRMQNEEMHFSSLFKTARRQ